LNALVMRVTADFLSANARQGTISAEVPSKLAEELCHMNVRYFATASILLVSALTACTKQQKSPEQIRQQTAQVTAEAKSDAKAVVEGIRQGWNRDRRLNLNSASKDQLLELPGMSDSEADRVIAGRPYGSSDELISRRIISKAEYDKISDRVEAK
jgi:competence protein ComEA